MYPDSTKHFYLVKPIILCNFSIKYFLGWWMRRRRWRCEGEGGYSGGGGGGGAGGGGEAGGAGGSVGGEGREGGVGGAGGIKVEGAGKRGSEGRMKEVKTGIENEFLRRY